MNPRDPSGGAYVDPAQWELGAQVETHPLVIAAIARAVAAERAACAAVCDADAADAAAASSRYGDMGDWPTAAALELRRQAATRLAAAIHARGAT